MCTITRALIIFSGSTSVTAKGLLTQVLYLHGNPQLVDLPHAALQSLRALRSLHVDPLLAEVLRRGDPSGFIVAAIASAAGADIDITASAGDSPV